MRTEELTADAVMEAAARTKTRLDFGGAWYDRHGGDKQHSGCGCAAGALAVDADPRLAAEDSVDLSDVIRATGLPYAAVVCLSYGYTGSRTVIPGDPHAHAVGAEVRRRVLAGEGGGR